MSLNDGSAGLGGFVAYGLPTPRWTNKWTLLLWLVMVAFLIVSMVGVSQAWFRFFSPKTLVIVSLGAPFIFMVFQMRGWSRLNEKIEVCVTGDGLAVTATPAIHTYYESGSWNAASLTRKAAPGRMSRRATRPGPRGTLGCHRRRA